MNYFLLLSLLISLGLYAEQDRAPRPPLQPYQQAVAGCADCQPSSNASLLALSGQIERCCQTIEHDFQVTWTILNNLSFEATATVDLGGLYTTLEACCNDIQNELEDRLFEIAGSFTVLDDLLISLTVCCDQTERLFQQTWTLLDSLIITVTVDLASIFTVLVDFQNSLTRCDLCSVFTVIDALGIEAGDLGVEINEVFTVISSFKNTVTACCAESTENFRATWTALDGLDLLFAVTADIGGVFTALDACCLQVNQDFQESWTILFDLKNTLTRCDFCSLFTIVSDIANSITQISRDTTTIFSSLEQLRFTITACCEAIDEDFRQTWTILLDIKDSLTACDSCGIYTVLDRNFQTIIGTYSSLEDLRATITDCCENLIATATTLLGGCSSSLITQAAVDAGGGQFVISVTGIYSLAENISSAGGPSGAIILITCPDVTLNMCGKSITASLATTPSGIVITDNLSNITVQNGAVINAYTSLLVSGGASDITIDRFGAYQWRDFGIVLFGITGLVANPVRNCTILQSVIFSGASNPAASANFGIFLANCSNCRIADTKVTNNRGVASQFVVGCYLQECSNCAISDSLFNDNRTYGLLLTAAFGTRIERCQMNGNGVDGSGGAGIRSGASTDTIITDCQTSFNSGDTVAGILFQSNRGTSIQGCVAQGNVGNGAGFTLIQENAAVLKNCVSLANTATTLGFEMSGFLLQTGTAVTCQGCIAEFNQGDQDTAGFRFIGQESSSIIECVSKNNLSALANAYGIGVETDAASNFPSTNNFIRNNDIQSNAGTVGSFGIADDAVNASTSLVAGNFAFNHTTNYSVSYASGALVPVTGSFSGALPAVTLGGTYDNLDINP